MPESAGIVFIAYFWFYFGIIGWCMMRSIFPSYFVSFYIFFFSFFFFRIFKYYSRIFDFSFKNLDFLDEFRGFLSFRAFLNKSETFPDLLDIHVSMLDLLSCKRSRHYFVICYRPWHSEWMRDDFGCFCGSENGILRWEQMLLEIWLVRIWNGGRLLETRGRRQWTLNVWLSEFSKLRNRLYLNGIFLSTSFGGCGAEESLFRGKGWEQS